MIDIGAFNKILGDILRKQRENKGFGMIKYSVEVGISHSYINKIEKARGKISLYELFKYCQGLDIPPSEIVKLLEDEIKTIE